MTSAISLGDTTVGALALEMPDSIRIFETWKIDYCCGGKTSLASACAAAGRTVDEFMAALETLSSVPEPSDREWQSGTLTSVAARIVSTYHAYTRDELQTLDPLAEKVLTVHGERRPELAEVLSLVRALTADMVPHMLKEEQVLFPYVEQLEEAAGGLRAAPTPFFGTVKNPVRMMMVEHDRVGDLLRQLRQVTSDYNTPDDACFSYRELYRRLPEFETRTHEHIHVENNSYFPRSVALEEQVGGAPAFTESCGMNGYGH